MFFDEVTLELEGGRGGNGAMCFHREKFVAEGPPDGGDGGNGGNVFLEADDNYNTLQHFMGRKHYLADAGENGAKNDMAGHGAEDMILKVPVGTLVHDLETKELVADLSIHGQRLLIAHGGRGGYGNGHFMASTRQAPMFAELGDTGEFRKVRLELRLVADVGLVGYPSAGKSTLIAHVSAARPKIAAYPFTTLVPNLGVVNLVEFGGDVTQNFVIADMPGIIEGASEGKGLGDQFLKHISRTATLIYVLDPFSYEGLPMAEQFTVLQRELKAHNPELVKKNFFVVMNKIDSIPEEDRKKLSEEFLKAFPKVKKVFRMVSGVSGEGLQDLMFELFKVIKKTKKELPEPTEENKVIEYVPTRFLDDRSYFVEFVKWVDAVQFNEPVCGNVIAPETMPKRQLYNVTGKRIEQISRMTNPLYPDAVVRVYDILIKMGIQKALLKEGALNGDLVKIGPHYFEFHAI